MPSPFALSAATLRSFQETEASVASGCLAECAVRLAAQAVNSGPATVLDEGDHIVTPVAIEVAHDILDVARPANSS